MVGRAGGSVLITMLAQPLGIRPEIEGLIEAVSHSHASDALRCAFTAEQWRTLATYLQPFSLVQGQILIKQGAADRSVYFVESGTLSVHREDDKSRVRVALVAGGSALGEFGFFSHLPRSATVSAMSPARLWSLAPQRFSELTNRHCAIALELAMGLGSIMAKRQTSRQRKYAIT